ncbi:S8 family serine peptidase [Pontibacillus sp. HMF3514]|uniref:S8 family serine peptidase n=1 Tax=Pontibacillus sp. HMF3514 TaxID=2692425 RepID=UPI00131F9608|nr:S8 family serine peptidase [Pontibacillus sp. HMF3514]QHE53803.1 S8 family serine peptidase [Pontibacillus sp. HMF3514]
MKKLLIMTLLLAIVILASPIQSTGLGEQKSMIIEVEGDANKWKTHVEKYYPRIEVVQVYDTLLQALAVKGSQSHLQQLEQAEFVKQIFPVQKYQVHANDSMSYLFDKYTPREQLPYTGKGVKVGVIDTGIDYEHPDLRKNYKGGYDVVDLDGDPMETKQHQGAPTLHGTHVAGIIAANGEFKGMAPDAELYGYRALGPGGMGTSVQVIAAIEQAVEDDMDIINLSLGNTINGPDWPTSIAVNKAVEMGVSMVISNGNSGPGVWTVGSPATAVDAIGVGASTPPIKLPYLYAYFERKNIPITPLVGSTAWDLQKDYPLQNIDLAKGKMPDLRGKIALIKRGEITFTQKAQAAERAGAVAAVIYNNEEGRFQGGLEEEVSIPVASISKESGEWIIENILPDKKWLETKYKTIQDTLADFSSKGPVTWNWDIKPDILAPGVAIKSTVPGGYKELQGTSMAAPHVAGALALIKEAHPDWGPHQLKAALLTTASPIKKETGEFLEPIAQGMGRIQPQKAIDPPTFIYNSRLTFGRVLKDVETREATVTIKNRTDERQEYYFKSPNQMRGLQWQVPMSFSLGAGEQKAVQIKVKIDQRQIDLSKPFHQGWITLHDEHNTYHLPYLFLTKKTDFPRVMGLEFTLKPFTKETYQYQVYLPLEADEFQIDLYNPDTLRFERTILSKQDVKRGVVKGTLTKDEVGEDGIYLAVLTIQKGNMKQTFETKIVIGTEYP